MHPSLARAGDGENGTGTGGARVRLPMVQQAGGAAPVSLARDDFSRLRHGAVLYRTVEQFDLQYILPANVKSVKDISVDGK